MNMIGHQMTLLRSALLLLGQSSEHFSQVLAQPNVRWFMGLFAVFFVLAVQAQNVEEIKRSAEQGNAAAQNTLGKMYETGEGVVDVNYAEAAKWYLKAAEQGNVEAQNKLGFMYQWSHGVDLNYAEAAKWYAKAAEQGDAAAQYNLAMMYTRGQGVSKNEDEAIKLFRMAAEQGNYTAKSALKMFESKGK
jgi:TPR repeat protein